VPALKALSQIIHDGARRFHAGFLDTLVSPDEGGAPANPCELVIGSALPPQFLRWKVALPGEYHFYVSI
jgi:hypothetical protein